MGLRLGAGGAGPRGSEAPNWLCSPSPLGGTWQLKGEEGLETLSLALNLGTTPGEHGWVSVPSSLKWA